MSARRAVAPGKVNLCLLLGPARADGYHDLASVMQPLALADALTVEPARCDEVVCPGIAGENLALRALRVFRERTGYAGPGLRITIDKRLPVAAGMGGGSADAAAVLRIIGSQAGVDDSNALAAIGAAVGADVPGLVVGGRVLVTGIGDRVEPLPPGPPGGVLVVPSAHHLATPDVYREADRLGLGRPLAELEAAAAAARAGDIPWVNDLEPAAISLCPSIAAELEAVRATGGHAVVSGSGPTVVGLYATAVAAERAAADLGRGIATTPLA